MIDHNRDGFIDKEDLHDISWQGKGSCDLFLTASDVYLCMLYSVNY